MRQHLRSFYEHFRYFYLSNTFFYAIGGILLCCVVGFYLDRYFYEGIFLLVALVGATGYDAYKLYAAGNSIEASRKTPQGIVVE